MYEEACEDYPFTSDQQFKYFYNLFDCEARGFHGEIVSLKCTSYKEAKLVMDTQYNNINRHIGARQYLQKLSISEKAEVESCNVRFDLGKLCDASKTYALQGSL